MRADVQVVRETLEGVLAPAVATAVLFDAIEKGGRGVPSDSGEVVTLVEGPLAELLERYVGAEHAKHLVVLMVDRLRGASGGDGDLELDIDMDIDVDIDMEDGPHEQPTREMARMAAPVSVLVVGNEKEFAERILVAIGAERVYTRVVADEPSLRHSVFSAIPLILVVDATAPPQIRAPDMAAALGQLPDSIQTVLWGAETSYGHEVQHRLSNLESATLCIEKREGVEPLLDLVLSRFKRASTIPPPIL